ncbi:MAG: hypothetical protein L0Z70_13745 [Chloroflexi bacterium]|nr:hypothetical protein [Chloroflexota bacterium]
MGPTILVVENDKDTLETIKDHLLAAGFTVLTAQSKAEAMARMAQQKISAGVVDVRLRDDDNPHDRVGLQVGRELGMKNIPYLVYSGFDTQEEMERAFTVAPGVRPPYAFIPKGEADGLDQMAAALRAMTAPRTPWEQVKEGLAGLIAFVLKIFSKL